MTDENWQADEDETYVPTTEQVRALYDERTQDGEFDRWLQSHDLEVVLGTLDRAARVAQDRAADLRACHKNDDCEVVAHGAQLVADDLLDPHTRGAA